MSTESIPLGELVEIVGGGTPSRGIPEYWNGGIPWATVKDMTSVELSETQEFISEKGVSTSATRIVPAGSVIMATRMGLGKVAINKIDLAINQDLKALKCNGKLDPKFLLYFLQSKAGYLESQGKGATVKGIKLDLVKSLPVPRLSLPEQRRIATILDKADAIRRKRRQAIDLMNDFLRSVFLEMFGDKAKGRKEWQEVKLKDLLTFLTSGSRGWAKYYVPVGDTFLRIQNVGNNKLMIDDVAFINAPVGAEAERTRVKAGDILLSITADLGRTAVIPKGLGTAYINQHLSILRIQGAEPIYVSAFLASEEGQRQIRRLDRVGVKSGLNFDDIRSLKILLPPHELQTSYIRIYRKVCDMESSLAASDSEIDAMRNALTYQLFHSQVT